MPSEPRSETVSRRAGCGKSARPDPWGARLGNWPGLPDYRYREALFPTEPFRRAYEALQAKLPERQAELEYLRVLHLAAMTRQYEVEAAIEQLLDDDRSPTFTAVSALTSNRKPVAPPELAVFSVDLAIYDRLLAVEVLQ